MSGAPEPLEHPEGPEDNEQIGDKPTSALQRAKSGASDIRPAGRENIANRRAEAQAQAQEVENQGQADLHELRKHWSPYLMKLLSWTTGFQVALILGVGSGFLPFRGNPVFLNTVASELFVQIAGMGYIVVRCLFPGSEPKKAALPKRTNTKPPGKS